MGETFRFSKDEDDHDHEICAYAWPIVILSGKLDSRRHSFYYAFLQESRGGGNKLSNIRGFVILRPGESITSFNKDNTQC